MATNLQVSQVITYAETEQKINRVSQVIAYVEAEQKILRISSILTYVEVDVNLSNPLGPKIQVI